MSTEVIVCCGVGGVGKTTTAAALAVGHAMAGHRVVVLTIDPARRLADALDLEDLGNEPQPVPLDAPGSLHALMLDRKKTFDAVVSRFTSDREALEGLLANRYYRAVSERLGGSQEYMAMEKLYELYEDDRFDVVVVDTPPTQHALDFFKAPDRIRKVFDRSVIQVLVQPGRGLIAATTRQVSKVIRRLVGDGVIEDIGEFFNLMSGMSQGFRNRGAAVSELLRARHTRYYLIASAAAPDRTDALAFLDTLREGGMQFAGFLVNRVIPDPKLDPTLPFEALPACPDDLDPDQWKRALDVLLEVGANAQEAADVHGAAVAALVKHAAGAPIWRVPELGDGIRSLEGLQEMARYLPPRLPS